ncbi:hypothetical protein [Azotobacter beijerinckii]|nr:hypothetical protein [Azotobacter beijerinckii]
MQEDRLDTGQRYYMRLNRSLLISLIGGFTLLVIMLFASGVLSNPLNEKEFSTHGLLQAILLGVAGMGFLIAIFYDFLYLFGVDLEKRKDKIFWKFGAWAITLAVIAYVFMKVFNML